MTMDPTRKRDLAVLLSATAYDDQAVPTKAIKRSHSDSSVCLTGSSCSLDATTTYLTQSVHQPRLSLDQAGSTSICSMDESCLVQPDRPTGYYKWWRIQQKNLQQNSLSSYSVQLIGDAAAPHLGCHILKTDLALCSAWGQNRVAQHTHGGSPLNLVLPVLTSADIVEKVVAGVLDGQISLSGSTVEQYLVLANSIGIEALEKACAQYLSSKIRDLTPADVFDIALLADHLGLSGLVEEAAEDLVRRQWWYEDYRIMPKLGVILQLAPYKQDACKRYNLLHQPDRGAVTELQVLELLDSMGCHEDEIISTLHMEGFKPAELSALLAALVSRSQNSYQLLRAAVRQQAVPVALRPTPDWSRHIRIAHFASVPHNRNNRTAKFQSTQLRLGIKQGKKKGQETCGVIVKVSKASEKELKDVAGDICVFAIHQSAPYVRLCKQLVSSNFKNKKSELLPTYLDEARKLYADDYIGPLTIGMVWEPLDESSDDESTS